MVLVLYTCASKLPIYGQCQAPCHSFPAAIGYMTRGTSVKFIGSVVCPSIVILKLS